MKISRNRDIEEKYVFSSFLLISEWFPGDFEGLPKGLTVSKTCLVKAWHQLLDVLSPIVWMNSRVEARPSNDWQKLD